VQRPRLLELGLIHRDPLVRPLSLPELPDDADSVDLKRSTVRAGLVHLVGTGRRAARTPHPGWQFNWSGLVSGKPLTSPWRKVRIRRG
jgi:hypothetical protein